jgi:hypothetical protein
MENTKHTKIVQKLSIHTRAGGDILTRKCVKRRTRKIAKGKKEKKEERYNQ